MPETTNGISRVRRAAEGPAGRRAERPAVLTIAAGDSAGMAGMAMDVRTQLALGAHPLCVLTACTAQNSTELRSVNPVAPGVVAEQLRAVLALGPAAVKIGLIPTPEQLAPVLELLADCGAPVVCDPVLGASCGPDFGPQSLVEALRRQLLPRCDLLTPNVPEASRLAGLSIRTPADMPRAAAALRSLGARRVLLKGGHLVWPSLIQDYYCDDDGGFWLASPPQAVDHARGTGCALASASAAALALGYCFRDAVVIAKMAVNQGLRHGYAVGGGAGPVAIDRFPACQADLPTLSPTGPVQAVSPFPGCGPGPLGLYPVVDRAAWLQRLLPLGVTTVQLRCKELGGEALAREIGEAVACARRHGCRLFINDHWELALAAGAYGVHLGQEDLDTADIDALRAAGLRLGVSSHCHYEVARAHALAPSYIACGPVYPTSSKAMPWEAQGLAGLDYWRRALEYPLVAIGGIDERRAEAVAGVGVSGVALISAITGAPHPEEATAGLLAAVRRGAAGHHGRG